MLQSLYNLLDPIRLYLQSAIICSQWKRMLKHLHHCERGNVAVIFAIMLVPIISVVGMSVDYSSAVNAKGKLQATLDAAALAAGRMLQTSGSSDQAEAAANKHFNATINPALKAALTIESIDPQNGKVVLSGAADIPTNFMGLIGIDSIKVASASTVEFGADDSSEIEISMMLDVTLSMYGSKLKHLKVAAKDLIQIILQSGDIGAAKTRIALVPFSESVRVHKYAQEVANSKAPSSKLYKVAKECVTERVGDEAFTDAAPNGQNKVGPLYNKTGGCKPRNDLIPLTNDKDTLLSAIDDFSAATGFTAGHLGTAWAWYTISPNWRNVWPQESRPGAYGKTVNKYAILMTDGEYNTQYYNGIETHFIGYTSPNGLSDHQADKLCVNMKASGITVFTIGFDLDSSIAKSTLKNCATSEDHYFLAEDGYELQQAFRQVAFRIAQLRLTK